jgi:hypothetical protein
MNRTEKEYFELFRGEHAIQTEALLADVLLATNNNKDKNDDANNELLLSQDQEEKLYLFCCMYRCRYCLPTDGNCTIEAAHCCIGSALSNALPSNIPVDLLGLVESYTMNVVSRSFLTTPPPPSVGIIQCFILKNKNKFELFMENKEQLILSSQIAITHSDLLKTRSDLLKSFFPAHQDVKDSSVDEKTKEKNMKATLLANAEYRLTDLHDIFLLAATRRREWSGNKYHIFSDQECKLSIGALKSNFGGSEFEMSQLDDDKRMKPSGIVLFDHFFEHTGSPVRIKVFLPNRSFYAFPSPSKSILKEYHMENPVVPTAAAVVKADNLEAGDDLEVDVDRKINEENVNQNMISQNLPQPSRADLNQVFAFESPDRKIEVYENLRPVWHDGMNAYVLHFDNHRVRERSVKNFKLVRTHNDKEKRTILQCGRVMDDRNIFVMDFAYPMTALQAFQICLSSIDPKLQI